MEIPSIKAIAMADIDIQGILESMCMMCLIGISRDTRGF
jgi:hypothetical protein